ncbi:MAG: hypothetical protein WBA93_32605 [Microcoleaceae cyanobacterium]
MPIVSEFNPINLVKNGVIHCILSYEKFCGRIAVSTESIIPIVRILVGVKAINVGAIYELPLLQISMKRVKIRE